MPNSKYEINNNEVQEIMRKPPNAFIIRGNIVILAILFAAFYFLNTFPLYDRETSRFEINQVNAGNHQNDSVVLVLSLNTSISKDVKPDQEAKLSLNNGKINNEDHLDCKVYRIDHTLPKEPLLYLKCGRKAMSAQIGMIGDLEIIIKERTFLSMLLDRFKM